MAFLDFALVIFGIYLVSQVFLPIAFPKLFEFNWLFKKSKSPPDIPTTENMDNDDLPSKIKNLAEKKKTLKKEVQSVSTITAAKLKEAEQINNAAKDLNNK
jgi:hypothetical protein